MTISTSKIPAIWKTSTIIPLLKPNKPAEESSSFRPVSLLCPSIKILERVLLPTLTASLPVPDVQHGFRKSRSTVTALNVFNQAIANGFNQKKPADRTLLLQLDLSKAFDMVSHETLLNDLANSPLPDHLKRWFNCYLHGRKSKVSFRGATSSARNCRAGVPQGAVSSPILFNFYLSSIPAPPPGIEIVQYADDISIYISGTNIEAMSEKVNHYVPTLTAFLEERNLQVSAEKSTVTLFTPATAEAKTEPAIKVQNKPVKLDKAPKLLGLKFDTMYTFTPHIKDTIAKAKKRLNILKSLAGSTWGQDKNTILMTYKTICRSVLEYAVPIWSPVISDSNWIDLQAVQSQALRIATGCHKMSAIDHLHQESKVLPLKHHSDMLSKQFTAQFFHHNHPGNKFLHQPPPPRNMKQTLLIHEAAVHDLLQSDMSIKQAMASIHTTTVAETIRTLAPNRVLKEKPPDVHPSAKLLSRKAQCELARLRSGFSRLTQDYLVRVKEATDESCPLCSHPLQDVPHLFNCQANPTPLTPRDLWINPKEAAAFLRLDEEGET